MTAAIELSADGFLQQINEYECIRDLGNGATAEVNTACIYRGTPRKQYCVRVRKHISRVHLVRDDLPCARCV